MAEKSGLLEELKRRHIWRAAIAYAVAGWLIVQIVTQVFPFFGIPDWGVRLVVILIAIGFPIAVTLAWVYEWTPEGLRRTEPADSPDARPEQEIRRVDSRLNAVILAVLILAVALLGWRLLVLRHTEPVVAATQSTDASSPPPFAAPTVSQRAMTAQPVVAPPAGPATSAAFDPPADSIVVLPFKNLSANKRQYFSDGITEELTGALGRNAGLSVIAWETASGFANTRKSPAEIGKALNVAHILDGSVQRAGSEVRVSVELVSTVSGRQLWATHYDDSLKNIFAVQDRITKKIANTLKVKFAGMRAAPTLNPKAHQLYLKALAESERYTATGSRDAQRDFRQALALDPGYADAWAGLAYTYQQLADISTLPLKEADRKARAAARKALVLDPHNANALKVLGSVEFDENQSAKARSTYQRALKLDPSNAHVRVDYGLTLPPAQRLIQFREAARLDPDSALVRLNLALVYQDLGDWHGELAAAHAIASMTPGNIYSAFFLAYAYTQLHRGAEAVKAFDLVQPASATDKQLVDAGRLTYRSLLKPALRPKALAALDKLRPAELGTFTQRFLLQLYLALGAKAKAMNLVLAGYCPANPLNCEDFSSNPMYAPLRGDPRFDKLAKQYAIKPPRSNRKGDGGD